MSLLALSSERPMSGYNYPVPDNPLVLPARRKTTTTVEPEKAGNNYSVSTEQPLLTSTEQKISTTTKQISSQQEKIGYNDIVPENPLTLPPRILTTTLSTTIGGFPIEIETQISKHISFTYKLAYFGFDFDRKLTYYHIII